MGARTQRPARLAVYVGGMVATLFLLGLAPAGASAQAANPRFGVWKLRSDAPLPALNIMTYEPWGEGGMRVTVEATNAGLGREDHVGLRDALRRGVPPRRRARGLGDGRRSGGRPHEPHHHPSGGKVVQVIVNTLSADGDRIDNEYRSTADDGSERVSRAVYERVRQGVR